jgi:hypothetical protein
MVCCFSAAIDRALPTVCLICVFQLVNDFMGAVDVYTNLAAVHLMFCKPVDVLVRDKLGLGVGASVSLRYELFPDQFPSFGVEVGVVDGEVYTTCSK